MPAMILSKEDWKEVQRASEAGVDDSQLSQDYGVSKASIRKRRQLDGWLTPRLIHEKVAIAKVKAELRQSPSNISQVSQKPSAEQSIAAKMLSSAELIGSQIMQVLVKKASQVAKNPALIDNPETVSDLGTIVNVSRKIAGLDKPLDSNVAVSLNFGAFWEGPVSGGSSPVEKPVVVDV